jgi:hypothetical protein
MRCNSCGTMNVEGRALCSECGEPLTRYAEEVTGRVRAETRAKARLAAIRPPAVPIAMALAALWCIAVLWSMVYGPGASAAQAMALQPLGDTEILEPNTKALGGLSAVIHTVSLIPVAITLAVTIWGVWTQRTWAWYVAAGAIILNVGLAVQALASAPVLSILRGAAGIAMAVAWYREDVRQWFCVGRGG